jgi:hypothetical protein
LRIIFHIAKTTKKLCWQTNDAEWKIRVGGKSQRLEENQTGEEEFSLWKKIRLGKNKSACGRKDLGGKVRLWRESQSCEEKVGLEREQPHWREKTLADRRKKADWEEIVRREEKSQTK